MRDKLRSRANSGFPRNTRRRARRARPAADRRNGHAWRLRRQMRDAGELSTWRSMNNSPASIMNACVPLRARDHCDAGNERTSHQPSPARATVRPPSFAWRDCGQGQRQHHLRYLQRARRATSALIALRAPCARTPRRSAHCQGRRTSSPPCRSPPAMSDDRVKRLPVRPADARHNRMRTAPNSRSRRKFAPARRAPFAWSAVGRMIDATNCAASASNTAPASVNSTPRGLRWNSWTSSSTFQRADCLAEWRLLDTEPLGRPRDVFFLGDSDEIAKMPKFHLPYPLNMNIAISI